MPTGSRGMSEASFQGLLMELLRMHGWLVFHHHDSRRQVRPGVFVGDKDAAGWPDLFCVRGKEAIAIEVKTERGKVSDKQHRWLESLAEAGIPAHVVRPSDLEYFKSLISRRRSAVSSKCLVCGDHAHEGAC